MSQQRTNQLNGAGRTLITAALVAVVGITLPTGCTSTDTASHTKPFINVSTPNGRVQETRNYITTASKQYQLPESYVSEAKIGMSHVERTLADADATAVQQQASQREGTARIAAKKQDAATQEQISMAQAEKLRQQYDAEQNRIFADMAAKQKEIASNATRDEALVSALTKERQTVQDDLISRANTDYAQAKARIEKLRTTRETTETEANAAIADMRESAKATRSRAEATVNAMRVEAKAVADQTAAQADELQIRIDTVSQQSGAESNRLAAKADSLLQEATAHSAELNARADALTTQASQEEYDLKVKAADSRWSQAQFANERAISEANSNFARAEAQISRLHGDAQVISELATA